MDGVRERRKADSAKCRRPALRMQCSRENVADCTEDKRSVASKMPLFEVSCVERGRSRGMRASKCACVYVRIVENVPSSLTASS
jgi:hypothetical protein